MDEVKRLCNSVMMMKDGNIVDGGTPEDLIEKYGQKNLEEVFLEIVRKDNEYYKDIRIIFKAFLFNY